MLNNREKTAGKVKGTPPGPQKLSKPSQGQSYFHTANGTRQPISAIEPERWSQI
jgi:hypothetical protein